MFGETRKQPTGLADLLLWFGLVEDGIVLQRDGSFLAAWQYRGPDLQSATHAEMAAVARRLNRILRLGSGWMIQVDCIRSFSSGYAPEGAFADPVTALIDRERREQFAQEGSHFENEYFLTLTYMPPLVASEKLEGFMISGSSNKNDGAGAEALRYFKAKVRQFEDVFAAQLPVTRLKAQVTKLGDGYERVEDELLAYLRRCLTGIKGPVMQPEIPVFLNDLLSMEDLRGGTEPMMGDRHLRTLALDGFPRSTYPGALSVLDSIPCEYRWNTRAILLDPSEAQGVIAKIGKKWKFQQRGLKDQVFKSSGGGQLNQFAMTMVSDSDGALAEATSGDVHFCYFSSSIVLQHKDRRFLDNMIGEFRKALINRGFGVRVEDINAVDAFFGTLPGNGVAQVRRVIAHTRNYVVLIVKPIEAGIETDLIVPTDKRTYVVRLVSDPTRFVSRLAFQYPDEDRAKWAAFAARQDEAKRNAEAVAEERREKDKKAGVLPMADNAVDRLYLNYKFSGDEHLRPDHVFDDGQHTYLIYPNDGRFRELPTLLLVVNGKTELVNFRVDGSRYIVDRLFDKAILVVGVGKKQTRVTITRETPYSQTGKEN